MQLCTEVSTRAPRIDRAWVCAQARCAAVVLGEYTPYCKTGAYRKICAALGREMDARVQTASTA